jgi:tetratricopeptide (TPR) repeat protein
MKDAPAENVARGLLNRGVQYGAVLGQRDKEIADYTRVIEMKDLAVDTIAQALSARGYAYGQLKQTEKQLADYTRIIEMKNVPAARVAQALQDRAVQYGELGQSDKQIADDSRIIDMKDAPTERVAWALVNRGWSRYERGELDPALEDSRRAFALIPKDPLPGYNIGVILLRQGKLPEARKAYETALAAGLPQVSAPSTETVKDLIELRDKLHGPPETTAFLGWAYLHAGQREKGIVELRTYLHDHPDGPLAGWARQLLADPPPQ